MHLNYLATVNITCGMCDGCAWEGGVCHSIGPYGVSVEDCMKYGGKNCAGSPTVITNSLNYFDEIILSILFSITFITIQTFCNLNQKNAKLRLAFTSRREMTLGKLVWQADQMNVQSDVLQRKDA